jgi:hypothetical protein
MGMRAILVAGALLTILLAGCSSEEPVAVGTPIPALPEETFEEDEVQFDVLSPVWVCTAGGCAGKGGPDFEAFGGKTYVAFRVTVEPSADPIDTPVPNAEVRITVQCSGDHATCPAGVLAEATGPWPQTLEASDFRIADPDQLVFQTEYVGPYPQPVNGSGGRFDIVGTLTSVAGSEVSDEDENDEEDTIA